MTTNQQADPLIGRLVDGRYRVRARIARGGMATVYVATDMRLERRIALKVMHAHLSDDSAFQSRFIQEARAAARLADPHVVNVFDQGQDGELAYLVMEYLPGITLRELLKEQKRLTVTQTITIMDAVLAGLAAAHRAGIVHRDVKPENVLLAEDGRIKIGDFGLARATTANTATGQQLLGTIAYLAPELVTRGTADARSDIYALGIMLYEMLVGEQPYKGEQPMQIAFQHATEQVPRPSIRNPGVPEALDELVLWATEKSPDERPSDAQEMLDRLREIEREIGVTPVVTTTTAHGGGGLDSGAVTTVLPGATAVIGRQTGEAPLADADNATLLRRRTARRRARGAFLLSLVLLLAVLAGGVGWWFGSGPGSLVAVPAVAGMTYEEAAAALEEDGFIPARAEENSVEVPAGIAIRSQPGEGERLDQGAEVTVVVSAGPAAHTVEPLNGKTETEAREYLASLNVTVAEESLRMFSRADRDTVINAFVTPRAGGEAYGCGEGCDLFEADSVELYVSVGAFPDVSGMSVEEATRTLTEHDLQVSSEPQYAFSDELDKGIVIGVADRAEEGNWRLGDTVTLIVSKGPELFPVPDVTGQTLAQAKAELEEHGFTATYAAWGDLPGFADLAQVTAQDPGSDASLPRGGTVKLTIQLSG
ncbi:MULTISPECIES: Stk1 family PASTA domain-containing Ser/Thr kinase [Microbacterium]|uniref:Stk1 family PASTA domain-containing Ser/Thr kinase n=1 Tax=Microbacterium TaxID=33882 RepID=UPI00217D917C|nr:MULTISPECIES: Stk1 family PASTA domain-containing Ser/Thr kinase [Microbacterium]UWF76786.1 Stk1 family PASTA domain-containing Ser/Thr kinase [Microbacterium neungamense]WCM54936.1 Stk1 family PASTA domain-containing Ser/Thr kinase [Microbacterium sp. EF45047]